jgi:hypothetical protein
MLLDPLEKFLKKAIYKKGKSQLTGAKTAAQH